MALATSGPAAAQRLSETTGVWESRGYGHVLRIGSGKADFYDVTDISCVHVKTLPAKSVDSEFDRIQHSGNLLSFYETDGITRYSFDRLTRLPPRCVTPEPPSADPERNFEIFWRAFHENYVAFDLRSVDWDALYRGNRPRISAATTPHELFVVMRDMVRRFDDRHVVIDGDDGFIQVPDEIDRILRKDPRYGLSEASTDFLRSYVTEKVAGWMVGGTLQPTPGGGLYWGRVRDDIGYINAFSMRLSVPAGVSQVTLAQQAIEAALAGLDGSKAIILDLRFNGGGQDAVALAIAAHFADERHFAFSKSARWGDGMTEGQPIHFTPAAGKCFTGSVYVLTSGQTASAAEIATLALRTLPNVVVMGTPTRGTLSDMLYTRLPNGWRVSMSNETYRAADGENYELRGIPPQVPVPLDVPGGLDAGMRLGLDAAVSLIEAQ